MTTGRTVDENDERRRIHALLLQRRDQKAPSPPPPPMPDSPWRTATRQALRNEDLDERSLAHRWSRFSMCIAVFYFIVAFSPLFFFVLVPSAVDDCRAHALTSVTINETQCSLLVRGHDDGTDENELYLAVNGPLRTTTHETLLASGATVYEERRGVLADSIRCWLTTTTNRSGGGGGGGVVVHTVSLTKPPTPSTSTLARCDVATAVAITTILLAFLGAGLGVVSVIVGIELKLKLISMRKKVIRRNALLRLFSIVSPDASGEDICDALTRLMLDQ